MTGSDVWMPTWPGTCSDNTEFFLPTDWAPPDFLEELTFGPAAALVPFPQKLIDGQPAAGADAPHEVSPPSMGVGQSSAEPGVLPPTTGLTSLAHGGIPAERSDGPPISVSDPARSDTGYASRSSATSHFAGHEVWEEHIGIQDLISEDAFAELGLPNLATFAGESFVDPVPPEAVPAQSGFGGSRHQPSAQPEFPVTGQEAALISSLSVHFSGMAQLLSAVRASSLPPSSEAAARRGALAVVAARAAVAETEARFTLEQARAQQALQTPVPTAVPSRRRRRRRGKSCLQLVCSYAVAGRLQAPTEDKCTICLEDMEVGQKVRTLPCFHMLHEACSTRYFSASGVSPLCPVCRAQVCHSAVRLD
mmetsp:Transcript_100591/g.300141  ORF Transcript_100591/g.300141 Transcript_100591/m.300141 type:complete len:364 (-) Transcript_100591:65-1156(-)